VDKLFLCLDLPASLSDHGLDSR